MRIIVDRAAGPASQTQTSDLIATVRSGTDITRNVPLLRALRITGVVLSFSSRKRTSLDEQAAWNWGVGARQCVSLLGGSSDHTSIYLSAPCLYCLRRPWRAQLTKYKSIMPRLPRSISGQSSNMSTTPSKVTTGLIFSADFLPITPSMERLSSRMAYSIGGRWVGTRHGRWTRINPSYQTEPNGEIFSSFRTPPSETSFTA